MASIHTSKPLLPIAEKGQWAAMACEYTYFQAIAAHCPFSATSISLYPNPTAEDLHIQGAQSGVSWEILDMTGRRIRTGTINDRPLQSISILGLPAGIYRLKLPTISLPFIIQ